MIPGRPRRVPARIPTVLLLLVAGACLAVAAQAQDEAAAPAPPDIAPEAVTGAAEVIGLELTVAERDSLLPDLVEQLESYLALRAVALPNDVVPALRFDPYAFRGGRPAASDLDARPAWSDPGEVVRPADLAETAFWPIGRLARLVATRQATSVELTELALARLKEHGPRLECVITLLEESALAEAAARDAELAAGETPRGPLHGIPCGVKDLLAIAGTRTTWGAAPYRDQVVDDTATVVERLRAAGAVIVAKLTLGALAWGDVWYGGQTRNPWNPEQGSSGSSAGSAAAVAAGLVPFAIGTETWGSIVSPSTRCGTTGLRPTFGAVSRAGAMALSWSMDKIGPIARTVEDCAIVFDAIRGPDGRDPCVVEQGFGYRPRADLSNLLIGYDRAAFEAEHRGRELDDAVLDVLRGLGATLIPVDTPDEDVMKLAFVLSAEAAAAFDELTRSNRDDLLVRQVRNAWPNVFRAARFIPAVEYVNANRERTRYMARMDALMSTIDVLVTPSFGGGNLLLTNLTGHPCVVLPDGFVEGAPHSITFIGRLQGEARLLEAARGYQEATAFHLERPQGF